jgi:hypothetical protein
MRLFVALLAMAQDPGPGEALRKGLESVKRQKSVKLKIQARIEVPNSDPLEISIDALAAGDLVFIEYHASGGNVKLIVRKGETVLQYHWILGEWVDAREMADGSAGRGLMNPNELIDLLLSNTDAAKDAGKIDGRRAVSLDLGGEKIRAILKDYLEEKEVRWADSSADARIELSPDTGLPARISSAAQLAWKEKEKIRYRGEATVESYGQETELTFRERDRHGKPIRDIPLTDDARKKLGLK